MKNPQFTLDYSVMYYDTDCGGVVHNLAYMRWVEECRTKMAPHIGIDYVTLARQDCHLVIVRHEVDYHSPAFMADQVKVYGWVERVEKSSFWCRFQIRRVENDKLCVSVRQRLALVQMPKGRPCRIPDEWHNCVAPAEDLED